jgi:hypothetical protein
MIADREGLTAVGRFGPLLRGFVQRCGGTIEEGDVLLTTDPRSCDGAVSHLDDRLVAMSILHDGRLVATVETAATPHARFVEPVVGRMLQDHAATRRPGGEAPLRVEGRSAPRLGPASFEDGRGEIPGPRASSARASTTCPHGSTVPCRMRRAAGPWGRTRPTSPG